MTGRRPPFTCPVCERTSWHPEDARQGYCGACNAWTGGQEPPGDVTCPECGRDHEATTFRVFGCTVDWPWLPGYRGRR